MVETIAILALSFFWPHICSWFIALSFLNLFPCSFFLESKRWNNNDYQMMELYFRYERRGGNTKRFLCVSTWNRASWSFSALSWRCSSSLYCLFLFRLRFCWKDIGTSVAWLYSSNWEARMRLCGFDTNSSVVSKCFVGEKLSISSLLSTNMMCLFTGLCSMLCKFCLSLSTICWIAI